MVVAQSEGSVFLDAEEEARFTKNLSNVEGTETDSVKLICEISKPSADVTWYKGDEELPDGGHYEHIIDGKRRILLIKDLKMADAGEYNCRLSSSIRTSGNLKINGMQRNKVIIEGCIASALTSALSSGLRTGC